MPLSSEQRLGLQSLIREHTILYPFTWHNEFDLTHSWRGTYIVDSIETIMDSGRHRARELCLPNSFIKGNDKAHFWFNMAAVASGMNEFNWHEIEYAAANHDDAKQRYVYTWTIGDATIKFFTKTFHTRGVKYLCWYVSRFADNECDVDSGCDTDSEDVIIEEQGVDQ